MNDVRDLGPPPRCTSRSPDGEYRCWFDVGHVADHAVTLVIMNHRERSVWQRLNWDNYGWIISSYISFPTGATARGKVINNTNTSERFSPGREGYLRGPKLIDCEEGHRKWVGSVCRECRRVARELASKERRGLDRRGRPLDESSH